MSKWVNAKDVNIWFLIDDYEIPHGWLIFRAVFTTVAVIAIMVLALLRRAGVL